MRRLVLPVILLAVASAAHAHPKLVSATPALNATVAKPARVELRFSERLMPKFSGAGLMMTRMRGMAHPPMKVAATAAVAADGRTLVVTPKSPLASGTYNVAWRVVSADTHRITGTHAFAVE